MTNDFIFGAINPFSIIANKMTIDATEGRHTMPHIHDVCEIYINISGNISFLAEQNIYRIKPGDIILAKPYEYHQCMYNDDSLHSFYWILFSVSENPGLFDFILNKKRGENNLIHLPEDITEKLTDACDKLTMQNQDDLFSLYTEFFKILSFVRQGLLNYTKPGNNEDFPREFLEILSYINKNYISLSGIREIADIFHISLSTIERMFKKYLSVTPRAYLYDRKYSNACNMLRNNKSATEACFQSGFADYSNFIQNFKKIYKITPAKFKKMKG